MNQYYLSISLISYFYTCYKFGMDYEKYNLNKKIKCIYIYK